jgi:hypothetical protein
MTTDTLKIYLAPKTASEAEYRLGVILDRTNRELRADNVTRAELEAAARALATRRAGEHEFGRAVWKLIADELAWADHYGAADRIRALLKGKPIPERARVRPAPGNQRTKLWTNVSRFPDALVRAMITFILEGGRLPKDCRIKIGQTPRGWGSGRGWGATVSSGFSGRRTVSGGKAYVRAPGPETDRRVLRNPGHGGYLPRVYFGGEERFFAVLAHELRHVFQPTQSKFRECRNVRRHQLGTNGKLCEVDACLFEIRALRRFRREFPRPAPAILPLP